MNKVTKLGIHNMTAKAALKVGSEAWVLQKREEQRLEAAHEIFETLTRNNKNWIKKRINVLGKKREHRT